MRPVHVVPSEGKWATLEEKEPVSSVHDSHPEAFLRGWKEAEREHVPLVDHREDGQIRAWHRPG